MDKPHPDVSKLSSIAKRVVSSHQKADAEIDVSLIDVLAQVRRFFKNIEELAESIRNNGLIQPVTVHKESNGRYRLVTGERRLRAMKLLGWVSIPVIIKEGLSEQAIRKIQIAENKHRDNLSAYEECLSIIEDVENFGTQGAMENWNHKESWICKRTAITRYAEPVLDLLRSDRCVDFELLHILNQIHEASPEECGKILQRIHSDKLITRDEASVKLSAIKIRQEAIREKQAKLSGTPNAEQLVVPVVLRRSRKELAVARQEIFNSGIQQKERFETLNRHATNLDMNLNEAQWVMWQSFLAFILPALEAIGQGHNSLLLKKLQVELKGKTPQTLWAEIHPEIGGSRQVPPAMPEGWGL